MGFRKTTMIALVGASLAVVPAVANAQATSLSLVQASRAGAQVDEANEQVGGFPFLIVFIVAAVGLGLYFAVDDSEDDAPTSP